MLCARRSAAAVVSNLRETGRVAGQWCLACEEIPWRFPTVDRLAIIPFCEVCSGSLPRRRRVCGGA